MSNALSLADADVLMGGSVATLDPRLSAVSAALSKLRAQAEIEAAVVPPPNPELAAMLHDGSHTKANRAMPLRSMAIDGTILPRQPRSRVSVRVPWSATSGRSKRRRPRRH